MRILGLFLKSKEKSVGKTEKVFAIFASCGILKENIEGGSS